MIEFEPPMALICEIINDDGTMARLPDLVVFAERHGLKIGTIASLIEHRSRNETLIERVGTRKMLTQQGEFDCATYRDRTGGLHIALTRGKWSAADEVLPRDAQLRDILVMHVSSLTKRESLLAPTT